ncbi:putative Outer membrane protein, OMP85 family [Crenothrix polyspora]|uniref:Putative Outer membrane protein, OMP85 family n=1 Tax=Crenothrix polyspora TaxID=360316 RepID=A0A1R4HDS5_9GAMM|nr:ShlB/FhaC/HecB family hemolysin secretion/activation protein [Crenothrix polyspora]SJM94366.1 putative Outer membrane protein, OMP85 family [Crenothrix polyspora]
MRSINLAVLVKLLLFCPLAVAEPVDMALPGRPSKDLPTLPEFAPSSNQPGFSLPPAPRLVAPEQRQPTNVRILLRALAFEGNTVFNDAQLQAIAKPYLNRPVSLTDLEALRLAFTQHYINNGYINSGAVLPEQTFSKGVIRFKIIEGVLSTIQVSGTERLDSGYVSSRLRLGAQSPLNFQKLQERFQMLLSDPLIERMNGQLLPGQQPGESVFDVKVVRKRPYQVNLAFDNHRPPSVGAEQGILSGWLRNVTGWGDEIVWDVIYSEGSLSGGGGLSLPLTAYDTRFAFDFNLSRTTALEQFADENIKSRYNGYNFALSQPLYQSLQHRLGFTSTLSIRHNQMFLGGTGFAFSDGDDENGRSQSTAVRNALDYSYQDDRQALALRSTLSVGINALGATWWSNKRSDGDFVSWLNQVQYVRQVLDNGSQLLFNSAVQCSNDRLLPLERFALGGFNSVRGYRENELVRDEGYSLSLEFRYPLFNNTIYGFPGKLTVATFMDYGAAWDHQGDGKSPRTLHSLGTGLIWNPLRQVQAEIYYAHALNASATDKGNNLQDKGIHFSVNISAF